MSGGVGESHRWAGCSGAQRRRQWNRTRHRRQPWRTIWFRARLAPWSAVLSDLMRPVARSLDWVPVTAELSSTTRERLRGVLVDARLGVTGRVRRPRAERAPPQREIILPVTVEEGLD